MLYDNGELLAAYALTAPPGLALTDPSGTVHAWWGDAPPVNGLVFTEGGMAVRWSATRFVVIERKPVGAAGFSGLVYSSRSFPVDAPGFAASLGVEGASTDWRPGASGGVPLLTDSSGAVLVTARRGPAAPTGPGSTRACSSGTTSRPSFLVIAVPREGGVSFENVAMLL